MNKILLQHFQKKSQLSTRNQEYQRMLSELFLFFVQNDHVEEDVTVKTFLPSDISAKKTNGVIVAKSDCVVAGIEEIVYLCKKHTKLTPKTFCHDGEAVKVNTKLLLLEGSVKDILGYERTLLNILQRMSGIATETAKYIAEIKSVQNKPLIAATRKTPWMHLDKKAVAVGGGVTHRLDLHQWILLKDNHLAVLESSLSLRGTFASLSVNESEAISYAIQHAKFQDEKVSVEVEVKTEKAAFAAIGAWQKLNRKNPFIIMLDNFTPKRAERVLQTIKKQNTSFEVFFEASGGVNLNNVSEWAKIGVDVISIGALTHSPKAADLSLDI